MYLKGKWACMGALKHSQIDACVEQRIIRTNLQGFTQSYTQQLCLYISLVGIVRCFHTWLWVSFVCMMVTRTASLCVAWTYERSVKENDTGLYGMLCVLSKKIGAVEQWFWAKREQSTTIKSRANKCKGERKIDTSKIAHTSILSSTTTHNAHSLTHLRPINTLYSLYIKYINNIEWKSKYIRSGRPSKNAYEAICFNSTSTTYRK